MKSLLLYSDDAWNNDRTDNFTNAQVKKESELTEEERETFYPCSMYFEVGATDDTGYETLRIEEQPINYDGEDFKMFVITMKGPNGEIATQNFPNPETIDCSKFEWAKTGFGGEDGDTVKFCLTGAQTSNKIDRKKIEDFISKQITDIRGEEEEEDSEAEFYPVGEGRILGDITATTEYQPIANAEEMASEYSVERINPTPVTGKNDVRAETFASEGSCTKCAETFAACGCSSETMNTEANPEVADVSLWDGMSMPEGTGNIVGQATPETDFTPFSVSAETFNSSVQTYASHAVPLGVGSVMGQATPDTDFTPFGTRAENFNAEQPIEGYWGATIDSMIRDLEGFKMTYGGHTPVNIRAGIGWSGVGSYDIGFQEYTTTLDKLGRDEYDADRVEIKADLDSGEETINALALVKDGYDPAYVSRWNAENFDAEQVVPFGVVGGGNDFGQNLAEDFRAESRYGTWAGLGLALLAGMGAKMALDRMDKKEEAPDSEDSSEESDEAPEA